MQPLHSQDQARLPHGGPMGLLQPAEDEACRSMALVPMTLVPLQRWDLARHKRPGFPYQPKRRLSRAPHQQHTCQRRLTCQLSRARIICSPAA